MISIDSTSIFALGGNPSQPQYGFRCTEPIAQKYDNHTLLNSIADVGTIVSHVFIRADDHHPLNMSHEYQIVWIKPNDGSHVFEIQLGKWNRFRQRLADSRTNPPWAFVVGFPFTDPTGLLPVLAAHYLKVRNHALDLLFETPFNVFYSTNAELLEAVSGLEDNSRTPAGTAGQGDCHFGVLKFPPTNGGMTVVV
ncbi:hypothetical protein JVT61DRAFT_11923 [Boletus reticuloceps]|uniref:Glycoside hydrolase 131 catalytic N-terminal domain-containing protein n=1 Tax=Boletus reticuloceps TaxID=495285 RepID=A0A8I3AEI1_9AGAM|nr:hypothetical protein JVT61DRAFT_11923 [Boletus reticuloceps]